MDFEGHLKGGMATGVLSVSLGLASGYIDAGNIINDISMNNINIQHCLGIFGTALFMSLFPDFDTISITQRWFVRIMLGLIILCYIFGNFDLLTVIAIATLLPMIHKHRGWTHWKKTPWLIFITLAIIYEYHHAQKSWFSSFSWDNVEMFISNYWIYGISCIIGHYTHLLLDSKTIRRFKNSYNHN